MKHVSVLQTRRLRDGRQLTQIADCPYCRADHWFIADGSSLAYMPCGDNRGVWLDGAGNSVR
jgi:hypothetical protein